MLQLGRMLEWMRYFSNARISDGRLAYRQSSVVRRRPRSCHYYLYPPEKYIYNNITPDRARPRKMIFPFSEDCRCIIFHDRYLWWDFYYECVQCLYPFFIAAELFDGILILWQIQIRLFIGYLLWYVYRIRTRLLLFAFAFYYWQRFFILVALVVIKSVWCETWMFALFV